MRLSRPDAPAHLAGTRDNMVKHLLSVSGTFQAIDCISGKFVSFFNAEFVAALTNGRGLVGDSYEILKAQDEHVVEDIQGVESWNSKLRIVMRTMMEAFV